MNGCRICGSVLLAALIMSNQVWADTAPVDFDAEFAKIHRELQDAQDEAAKYSGGLVLSMIELRIQILKVSEALLDQQRRQPAVIAGARVPATQEEKSLFSKWFGKSDEVAKQTPIDETTVLKCSGKYGTENWLALNLTKHVALSNGREVPVNVTPLSYSWTTTGADNAEFSWQIDRYTLLARFGFKKPDGSDDHIDYSCARSNPPILPDDTPYAIACKNKDDAKEQTETVYYIDPITRIETDMGGKRTPLRNQSNAVALSWDLDDGEENKTSINRCFANRYTGEVHCFQLDAATSKFQKSIGPSSPQCRLSKRQF